MKAEEFLINMWNKCIWMSHDDYPGNIIMIYDKQHERKLKLNSLNNSNDEINFIKTNESIILFYQDYNFGYFEVSNKEIWSVLESKYNLNYKEIKELITKTLLEDNKLKQLLPDHQNLQLVFLLLEDNKLTQLTTYRKYLSTYRYLLEDNKLTQLKPIVGNFILQNFLLEDKNLNQI